MIRRLGALHRCTRGSVLIEFAVLGPLLFTLLLAVFQFGLGLQSYNALRGVTADVARHVEVEYQKAENTSNPRPMSEEDIRLYATRVATQAPYLLDRRRVTVSVAPAAAQRIADARELTFRVIYVVPSVLSFIDLPEITVQFTRPIFVPA